MYLLHIAMPDSPLPHSLVVTDISVLPRPSPAAFSHRCCSLKQPVSMSPAAELHHGSSISRQHHCLTALAKQQLPAS